MFAFVTSMPHPANCASYRRRSLLLSDTLESVLRQDDPDFGVVLVVNEVPECTLPDDPRIEVVQVSFPPSSSRTSPSLIGIQNDKGAKLGVGTSVALRSRPRYVMFVDSDDYIHRGIVGFASRYEEPAGWYSDAGFFHVRGARTVRAIDKDFHQRNGSTHILRADLLGVPDDLDPGLSREEVLERIGRERAHSLMGMHRFIVAFFHDMGMPLAPLPFAAAIWEIGTGENCTGALAAAGRHEPVAGRISDDYGLRVPGRARAFVSGGRSLAARASGRLSRSRKR